MKKAVIWWIEKFGWVYERNPTWSQLNYNLYIKLYLQYIMQNAILSILISLKFLLNKYNIRILNNRDFIKLIWNLIKINS